MKNNPEKKETKEKTDSNRTWRIIYAIIVIIVILVGFYFLLSLLGHEPIREIKRMTVYNKESCEREDGHWSIMGLSDKEGCILHTDDEGKVCSDSNQCQGMCLADLTQEEEDKLHQDKIAITKDGKCTGHTINYGCLDIVKKGKVEGMICMD